MFATAFLWTPHTVIDLGGAFHGVRVTIEPEGLITRQWITAEDEEIDAWLGARHRELEAEDV